MERDAVFGNAVISALSTEPDAEFAISPLVKLECLVRPIKSGDRVLQRYYEAVFGTLVQLAMPDAVFLQAAELRTHLGLRTPDALHLACAQHYGCAALWTNDERLAQTGHGLARNVIE